MRRKGWTWGGGASVVLFGLILVVLLFPSAPDASAQPDRTPSVPVVPPANALGSSVDAATSPRAPAPSSPPALRPDSGSTGGIDPYSLYLGEPAPMGITDYGVLSADGAWYRYATPEVLGTADLHSLRAYNSEYRTNLDALQLNANVVLTNGSTTMVFWFQDVAEMNSTNNGIDWEDNVWNVSSGATDGLAAGAVEGNGTVQVYDGYGIYIASAATDLPGDNVYLRLPAEVDAEMIASEISGVPSVGMRYDDGHGWQTYDNITIPWARGWQLEGFVVDGSKPVPLGTFYDLEYDLTGPGDGLSDRAEAANVSLGLQYWNGHNLQAPTNAFDFGSDTGETMSNVSVTAAFNGSGTPSALITSGSGAVGKLYGPSTTAVLNVSANVSQGTLRVGGDPVAYVGGSINLTVGPGTYNLTLLNGTDAVAWQTVNLSAGEYLPMVIGGIHADPVWINETGLPTGTRWNVTFDGTNHVSSGSSLRFVVDAGEYAYSFGRIPGYHAAGYSGQLDVVGPVALTETWIESVAEVELTALGLPPGTPWNATLGNVSNATTGSTLAFWLPNGTYSLALGAGVDYLSNATGRSITVNGSQRAVDVYFQIVNGLLEGTVDPEGATVAVNGSTVAVASGAFEVSVPPGTYSVSASAPGFVGYSGQVQIRSGVLSTLGIVLNATSPVPAGTASSGGGITTADLWAGGVAGGIGAALLVAFVLVRRR
jgi:Thermopsin/PEGA domain